MSKRNFILFIIILLLVTTAVLGYFYLRTEKEDPLAPSSPSNFFANFNPFKRGTQTQTPSGEQNSETLIPSGEATAIKLRRISSVPVAGFSIFQKERLREEITTTNEGEPQPQIELAPAVRYVERATGNIYQTWADEIEEKKFSATVVPRIYEAYFGESAESVVMRYLKSDGKVIATFSGSLPEEILGVEPTGTSEITGTFLPDGISDLSVSPEKTRIFYLLPVGGGVVGVTAGILGDRKTQVFESPFTEWLPQWANSTVITLTTKPSYSVPGHMFVVNPERRDLRKMIGDVSGLTALTSPSGRLVLYADNTLSLRVYNVDTRNTVSLGARTLPEKCTWNLSSTAIYCAVPISVSGSLYPDAWYKGEVSFSDEIWKIDATTGAGNAISDLTSALGKQDIDAIKLAVDQDESYLMFVNKKDSILWELLLN